MTESSIGSPVELQRYLEAEEDLDDPSPQMQGIIDSVVEGKNKEINITSARPVEKILCVDPNRIKVIIPWGKNSEGGTLKKVVTVEINDGEKITYKSKWRTF